MKRSGVIGTISCVLTAIVTWPLGHLTWDWVSQELCWELRSESTGSSRLISPPMFFRTIGYILQTTPVHCTLRTSSGLVRKGKVYRLHGERLSTQDHVALGRHAAGEVGGSLSQKRDSLTRVCWARQNSKTRHTNTGLSPLRTQTTRPPDSSFAMYHHAVHSSYLAVFGSRLSRGGTYGDPPRVDHPEKTCFYVGIRSRYHTRCIFFSVVGAVCWFLCETQPAQHASLQKKARLPAGAAPFCWG